MMAAKPVPVECCGKKRDTPFCAECGRELPGVPARGLLAHVRAQVRAHGTRVEELREQYARNPEDRTMGWPRTEEGFKTLIPKQERLLAKWESWEKDLRTLLAERQIS